MSFPQKFGLNSILCQNINSAESLAERKSHISKDVQKVIHRSITGGGDSNYSRPESSQGNTDRATVGWSAETALSRSGAGQQPTCYFPR